VSTLDNLRKDAKRWLKALRSGNADARARLLRAYPAAPATPGLRDVQHALAREHGWQGWLELKTKVSGEASSLEPLEELLRAAGEGNADAVGRIVDTHPDLLNARGQLGSSGRRTALHFGVGHEPVVRTLLERGADPNVRDEGDDAFPIHFAAERGDLAVVKLLVEHGADPIGAGTGHELDAPGWAVCFDYAFHPDVARYLLDHGAPYSLFTAVALGEPAEIRRLAESGVNVNQRMDRTNHRRTALHLAVLKKQPASLAALLERGADPNIEDAAGLTPLDVAALTGETETAQLLIEGGAAVTVPAAIALDRREDFERLARANPNLMHNNRRWARMFVRAAAQAPGDVLDRIIKTTMRYRAGLTIVNLEDDEETAIDGAHGYTALHAAAFAGNNEAVKVLLKHGANVRARDSKYCGTPAGWARHAGHHDTADLILEADIDIFEAISADRADRVAQILDRDPGAIDRPFKAYADCGTKDGQWWPEPDCTPLRWATTQNKQNAARALLDHGAGARTKDDLAHAARIVRFLQTACWDHHVHGKGDHRMYDRAAQRLLAAHPEIARNSIYTAIVCGDIEEVRRLLRERPEAATQPGGGRHWTPILYLAYTRFTHQPTIDHALEIANLLLDHGANPNDFYMAGDAPYTVLVGVAGEGEQDSPRQPYAERLFDLLLARGADPFAIQVLYDTHFSGDMLWWLELVYRHTIDTPRGAAWKDPEWSMFDMGGYGSGARFILETAVNKGDMRLAEWALARGANPNAAPARDTRFPKHTLYQHALMSGLPGMAELLARYGATRMPPALDDEEQFVDACFRLDREEARRQAAAHPEYLRSTKAIFAAARRDRADVVEMLLDLGVPLEIRTASNQRTLHEAAAHNALRVAQLLVERGAEIDPVETQYGATPIGWAAHGDKTGTLDFLSRHSRNIWTLCFRGYVDRVREVLRENPELATIADADGITPLWWLPDDDEKALQIVELLIRHGADPARRNKNGRTAADWARDRGMQDVAARLEQTSS